MTSKIFNDTKYDIDSQVSLWCRVIAAVAPSLVLGAALGIALFNWVMA